MVLRLIFDTGYPLAQLFGNDEQQKKYHYHSLGLQPRLGIDSNPLVKAWIVCLQFDRRYDRVYSPKIMNGHKTK